MFTKSVISLLCCFFLGMGVITICYGSQTDDTVYNYLKNLELEDLTRVEVTLDEVFDVFNGLVRAKKVTIATGTRQSTTRAPAVTTVITAQDIEAIGARDLDEVLETVPGLHVARSGGLHKPLYSIRGILSDYNPEVLVLINGIPITALYTGDRSMAWGGMPINMISRIEVIRGPGSAVYGADAFAGVINIMTKTKEDIKETEVGTRAGSFNTYEGWALHGDNWNGVEVAASVEYRTTDGQNSIISADAQTQYDKLFKTHASFAPGSINLQGESVDARVDVKKGSWQARAGYQGRYHIGTGAGVSQALDPTGYLNASRTNADLTYHNPTFMPHWDVTTQLSYFDNSFKSHYISYPPGAFGGTYPDGYIGNVGVSDRNLRLDTFTFYSGFQKHVIRVGVGYHHNNQYRAKNSQNFGINPATGLPLPPGSPVTDMTGTPYSSVRKAKRKNWYLSLQDTWTIASEWELTAGIRYDDYSDFGGTTNPRAALVWQPSNDFTTKLMYGRAFRAPAFTELYNQNNPVALGNLNLKPETNNTWELAFDYRATQNLHLATNLFRYDIDDKISTIPSPDGKSRTFQNTGRWKGEGLELEARWKMSTRSSVMANYSYAKVSNKGDGKDIGKYPQQSAYVRTDWLLIPNWYLDVQAKWIADRQRTLGDPRSPIADYTTVDLTLRYKDIREGRINIALSVRNLFDADAREPSLGPTASGVINVPYDLPLAGRSYFLEWRYQFR